MTRQGRTYRNDEGVALIHMAIFLPMLLLFTGLAVDSGRAYLVKAQLSKAVDGAALSAARNLNGGNPKGEAAKVFNANFPSEPASIFTTGYADVLAGMLHDIRPRIRTLNYGCPTETSRST